MSDKPFKMKGHMLPGPNQRSALKNIEERQDLTGSLLSGSSGSDTTRRRSGGERVGLDIARRAMPLRRGRVEVGENYEGGEDYSASTETAPVDTGVVDSDTGSTKKKVDVEVTVNGQKV